MPHEILDRRCVASGDHFPEVCWWERPRVGSSLSGLMHLVSPLGDLTLVIFGGHSLVGTFEFKLGNTSLQCSEFVVFGHHTTPRLLPWMSVPTSPEPYC
jgi:hypothetical protein